MPITRTVTQIRGFSRCRGSGVDPFLPRQCPLDDPKEAASKDKTGCLSRERSPVATLKRVFLVQVTHSRGETKWGFWAQSPGTSARRMTDLGSRLTPGAALTMFGCGGAALPGHPSDREQQEICHYDYPGDVLSLSPSRKCDYEAVSWPQSVSGDASKDRLLEAHEKDQGRPS